MSPDGVEQDFTYAALGQLEALTYTVDGEEFDFKVAYDGLGRVVNVAYPKIGGQPQRFSVGRSYTPSGYLGAVYNPNAVLSFPYWRVDGRNADDELTHATLGDGTVGIRNYEPETGLLASISEGQSLALSYGYYADGSLASRQDTLADRDETFTYDAFHRLASWNLPKSAEIGYRYDDLGNLTEIWSKATPWGASVLQEKNTYGTNGKPHALTQGPRGAYTYDARGRQDTAPTRAMVAYNERDLPRKITSISGEETLFAYDASGARVKKQGPSGTVVTLGGLYERRTVAGHIQHIFYVTGGDEGPVARVVSEQGDELAKAKASYLHHDPLLESVVAVSGAGGTLKESFYYEPFGQRTDAQGKPLASAPSEVGSGFTGQEHDEDLELINFRGRLYDPAIRRFLSADPHVTHPLSGQSYNRYSYVVNDPTNLIDPTGFDDIGQEYGGWGTEYSSAGYESTYGNDYSGCFTRVDGATPVHTGGSGGVGWSTIGGINVGAPVQAVERQRQVSMPTGPSTPAGAISGPVVQAKSIGNDGGGGEDSASQQFTPPQPDLFTPGEQPVKLYIGNDAHDKIARSYAALRPGQTIFLNSISLKSIVLDLGKNVAELENAELLRPDILNATTLEIYEIKPSGSETAARLQLAMYSAALARAGIPVTPGGSGPGTHGVISAPGGYYQYWTQEPGIISYKWVTPRMRLWGVAPEAWAVGGGVVFAVALATGAGAVTLIPEAVPETAVSIGGLIPAF